MERAIDNEIYAPLRATMNPKYEDFISDLIQYMEFIYTKDGDDFFFDYMEAIRLLDGGGAIAYTTPDAMIWLNAPQAAGEDKGYWDFIYCHECCHQLWDTFGVGEKVKQKLGDVNHTVLNVASDCVINDWLRRIKKKKPFNESKSIYPEVLEKMYGVKYNPAEDTQFTLYEKLLPFKKQIMKDWAGIDEDHESGEQPHQGKNPKQNPNKTPTSATWKKGYEEGYAKAMDELRKRGLIECAQLHTLNMINEASDPDYDKGFANGYQDAMEEISRLLRGGGGGGNGPRPPQGPELEKPDVPKMKPTFPVKKPKGGDSEGSGKSNVEVKWDSEEDAEAQGVQDAMNGKPMDPRSSNSSGSSGQPKNRSNQSPQSGSGSNDQQGSDQNQKDQQGGSGSSDDAKKADAYKEGYNQGAYNKGWEDAQEGKPMDKSQVGAGGSPADQKAAQDAYERGYKESEKMKKDAEKVQARAGDSKKIGQQAARGGNQNSGVDIVSAAQTKHLKDILRKYSNHIGGDLEDLLKRMQSSARCEKDGIKVKVERGHSDWNKEMTKSVNAYIKQVIWKRKQELKKSYSRPNRRQGVVNFGQPIQPGKTPKKETFTISTAYYVDRSGSMSGCIDEVWSAAYGIAKDLQRYYSKEAIVDEVVAKFYAWNYHFKELKYGQKVNADDGTMPLHKLCTDGIEQFTDDFNVNVIITDGGFESCDVGEVQKFINRRNAGDQKSLTILICNGPQQDGESLAKANPGKFVFIEADSDFNYK